MHAARRWGGCGVGWTPPRKGRRSTTRARPCNSSWKAQRGRRWRCAPRPPGGRPAPPAAVAAAHMVSGGGASAIQLSTPHRHRRQWALSRARLPRCCPASQPSRCCVGLMQRARHARRCVCVLPQAWQSGGGGQTLLPARMPNGSRLSSGVPTHRIVRGGGGGGGAGPCLPSS